MKKHLFKNLPKLSKNSESLWQPNHYLLPLSLPPLLELSDRNSAPDRCNQEHRHPHPQPSIESSKKFSMVSSQERQSISISHSSPCYPLQRLSSGWIWSRDGAPVFCHLPFMGQRLCLGCDGELRIQGSWLSSPLVGKAEVLRQEMQAKKNRDCSFPSFFTEHGDPKAGVSPGEKHTTVPSFSSRGMAQRVYPEGGTGYFEALPKRTEFNFNRELRMFKPKGMLKNNGWYDEK